MSVTTNGNVQDDQPTWPKDRERWARLRVRFALFNLSSKEIFMDTKYINRLRIGGFIGACVAAVYAFISGDYATAGGIVAAALSTAGGKPD